MAEERKNTGRLIVAGVILYLLWNRRQAAGAPGGTGVGAPGTPGTDAGVPGWIQQLGSTYYSNSYTTNTQNGTGKPFWCGPSTPAPLVGTTPYVPYHQMTEGGAIIQPPF